MKLSVRGPRWLSTWLLLSIVSTPVIGQEAESRSTDPILAGGIEFVLASVQQGRELLSAEDDFVRKLSPFDRQARMRSRSDPGTAAYLRFVRGEVRQWMDDDIAAIGAALEKLDKPLRRFSLPHGRTVYLVHTTGREESGAAYTRGTTIVLPQGKAGTSGKPSTRLIAHELFHVLSRSDARWRDRLYSIIGFNPTGEIRLPESLRDRRITNPDAPHLAHAMKIRLDDQRSAFVAPVLTAKSAFDPQQPSLFRYIDFKLMEVEKSDDESWAAVSVGGKPVLHEPSIPDFHRQIGRNTGYIIHPEEILAVNFALLVTGSEVKDKWLTDAIRAALR